MINNKKHLLFCYDEGEAYDMEKEKIMEDWEEMGLEERPTEQEAFNSIDNYDFLDWYYEDFKENLSEFLGADEYFADHAKGMGWRNLEGFKVFRAKDALEFIRAITPKTSDFTLMFYKGGKKIFYVKIFHHDAPTGESHKIRRLTADQFEKLENNY